MWFIVWRGWGAMALPILAGTATAVFLILSVLTGALGIQSKLVAGFALALAMLVAAAANWRIGKRLNGKPPRELIDAKTGQRVLLQSRHDLFWIKMEYWSVPVALAALASLVMAILSAFK